MIPISTVAATIPKSKAAMSRGSFRFMRERLRVVVRMIMFVPAASLVAMLGAMLVASCNETTPPALRYPVLDDIGTGPWRQVATGGAHTCALRDSGDAYCWGSNQFGQLGITTIDTACIDQSMQAFGCTAFPQRVTGPAPFAAITAGVRHTCALATDGSAYCWGANEAGQLGTAVVGGPTVVWIPQLLPFTQISAGANHTCAIRSDGALFCWGANDRGQLGDSTAANSGAFVRVPLADSVVQVSAGQSRTCALSAAGTVYCWGAVWVERQGSLEITRDQRTPQLIANAPAFRRISVGGFATCGVDSTGVGYCWEGNPRGGLGDGSFDGSTTPTRIASDEHFAQVSAGLVQTCGITTTGAGYCWGDDTFGQLGATASLIVDRCGDVPCSSKPIPVIGRQVFTSIATGLGSHTCGVTDLGNLYCWGLGTSGQRGDGILGGATSTPIAVAK